jgi:hypothetical protein
MDERAAPALTPEQISELLPLIGGADSVELKLTVPESTRRSAVTALDLDPIQAQIRQVAFFDTPDLALNAQGVVVRARRVQAKPGDAVVKLRPVVPADLPPSLRRSPNFGVEVDAMPGGFVCSASMSTDADDAKVKDTFHGRRPLERLFSKAQRSFYATHAPAGLSMGDLSMLGPITVLKLKLTPPDFGRRLVAEVWTYPDGSRILELSTKCAPEEGFRVAAEAKAFFAARGIELSGEQQTKTKTALQLFANELRSA